MMIGDRRGKEVRWLGIGISLKYIKNETTVYIDYNNLTI